MSVSRLRQVETHLNPGEKRLSFLSGPTNPSLTFEHLSGLLDQQCASYGDKEALICFDAGTRYSYNDLRERAKILAKGLLVLGVKHGDCIGIMAGNRVEYVDLFFAAARVGAMLAVVNSTYTPDELCDALRYIDCKVLLIAPNLGNKDNKPCLEMLRKSPKLSRLEKVVMIDGADEYYSHTLFTTLRDVLTQQSAIDDALADAACSSVGAHDVCNLQFTSGTTGKPKAAMLTHHNIINNARFIGQRMHLTAKDVLCCPPPLYHCFGLVLGLLACITHGATIIFPSEVFEAKLVIQSVLDEKCTALHGVPAMWVAELRLLRPEHDLSNLRTGIAAGSGTPRPLMEDLRKKLNLREVTNTYGMTETSPASFMTSCTDPLERRLSTVGKIMPHTTAKIIDPDGKIVPIGHRGELCVSGYLLQKGYWNNPEKTQEVMLRDEQGILWMHTGDEASFDDEGYCTITGRIKDMVIRGGENIFPAEIEARLMQHTNIANASVVGIKDEKYGEVVGVFLESRDGKKVLDREVQDWVTQRLARQKMPRHIFWLGEPGVGDQYPLTGSGKVKKHILRDLGFDLVQKKVAK
ncbi:acetyl-CoA synthetase-like protein [Thozetella sp. PMI_491]|nr:acetyl-CoA synthetase-like protein [Thozetella sp. PMI_491]